MVFPGIGNDSDRDTLFFLIRMHRCLSAPRLHHLHPPGSPLLCQDDSMLHTKDIIREIWAVQGYGNLAIWDDGTTLVVEPGQVPVKGGMPPRAVLKPLPLVIGFQTLDPTLGINF
jgi:hypothetical protein